MATASLNIKLDYNQVLELARQLSEEEKELDAFYQELEEYLKAQGVFNQ